MIADLALMAPHQRRVVTEESELADRAAKLNAFIWGERFMDVDIAEQNRLIAQRVAMEVYLRILRERIAAFEVGA
jgi:hypothetical protein